MERDLPGDDWTFARPLPPGAFPDEDHVAGGRLSARKRDRRAAERARRGDQPPRQAPDRPPPK